MSENLQTFDKNKKLIDRIIYLAAITYPLTTIPQILDIFTKKSAVNVSLMTWVLYDAFTVIFLWYAIEKRLKPLIIEYSMWIFAQTIIVVGVIMYQ